MTIFYLPDLGEGIPEADIVKWHVKEGDEIKEDEVMVSVETAKAVVEGNVHYQLIEMVKGSQVNGNLVYDDGESSAKEASKTSAGADAGESVVEYYIVDQISQEKG